MPRCIVDITEIYFERYQVSQMADVQLERRQLGQTSIKLTVLGFGGSRIGNLYRPIPEHEANNALSMAFDSGVRYFDTAPLYGHGLGEKRTGTALLGKSRNEFSLSTKVGRLLDPRLPHADGNSADTQQSLPQIRYDYGYDGVMRSVEDSLVRLGMDRIDIALIHDIDAHNHGEEQPQRFREAVNGGIPALKRLCGTGTVGAVGVAVNDWRVCVDCLNIVDVDCFLLAGRYTLLEHESLKTLLPECERRGIGVILGAPYNSGVLAKGVKTGATYFDRPVPTHVTNKVRRMQKIADTYGVSLPAAALRFPLGHPVITCVLPGVSSADGVAKSLQLFNEIIPVDFWLEMKDEGLIAENAPVPCN